MMKKILLLTVVLSVLGLNSCKDKSSDSVVEIITDTNFANGIGLEGSNSSDTSIIRFLNPFGVNENDPDWNLAQWGSRYNLKEVEFVSGDDGISYTDSGKSIAFKLVDNSAQITMKMFGSNEYPTPRKFGEDWPHILLEQKFKIPQSVNNIKSLNLNLDFILLNSEMKMPIDSFNPELHTIQFT